MALRTGLLIRLSAGTTTNNRLRVFCAGFLLLYTVGFIYYNKSLQTGSRVIKQYPACPIPQLEPFHESIRHLVNNKVLPLSFNCTANYTLLFNSTFQSTIIPAKGPDYFRDQGYESCCYRRVARYKGGVEPLDDFQWSSQQCFPVNLTTETKIPIGYEFIAIYCKREGQKEGALVDVHTFVPLKPRMGSSTNETREMEEKFNVIIFGLDAMSRMNFLRTMPQSHSFLKNELEAVEMVGYNKIGENTAPNVMPMLMSGMPTDLKCFNGWYYDECPFIWKEYSKQGYYTMYAEDDSDTSIFRYHNGVGFNRQPTDYYPRPLSHFAEHGLNQFTCYGPRLTFQFLLDYMEKFVHTMSRNKKNFLQFTWATALTHAYVNGAGLGDPHLLKSLRWMKESGHLKNTIFILMSDHGSRLDGIRSTVQGQLEDRLPFLYFVVPESFKIKHKLAYKNLLYNADKLITTYDLHESLKDILNLDMIRGRKLLEREDDLFRLGRNLTRGISLFLPIPEFRTCKMAGIDMIFCSCNYMEVVNVSDPEINDIAKVAVSHINSILEVSTANINNSNSRCAHLELHNVSMARRTGFSVDKWRGYLINFETKPGGAQFEAMVERDIYEGSWTAQDPIVRTNRYGNQSHCVRDFIKLKPYCYCLD